MNKVYLRNLHVLEYEHPMDRILLDNVRAIPFLPKIIELLMTPMSMVKRLMKTGSHIKVSERQYPTLYRMLQEACAVLEMDVPHLYVCSDPAMNAYTSCPDDPIIVIYSYLLDMLEDDEIMFVLGHELAHIKSGHIVYKQLALALINLPLGVLLTSVPGLSTIKAATIKAIKVALGAWSRASEYTCDRGGYLACQNYEASCTALMKLAGYSRRFAHELSVDEFMKQAREFSGIDANAIGKITKLYVDYLSVERSHPWDVDRARALMEFNDSGEYSQVLQRKTERIKIEAMNFDLQQQIDIEKCPNCGTIIFEEGRFCGICGKALKASEND